MTEPINVEIEAAQDTLNVEVLDSEKNIDAVVEQRTGTDDHSQLQNLDYEHSGHTGFVPARLSVLPTAPPRLTTTSEDRANTSVYAFNDKDGALRVSLEQIKGMNTKIESCKSIADVDFNKLDQNDYVYIEN